MPTCSNGILFKDHKRRAKLNRRDATKSNAINESKMREDLGDALTGAKGRCVRQVGRSE